MKEAIDNEVLPDPRVFLIPLSLETKIPTESIWKNPKGKEPALEVSWANRWAAIRQKTHKVRIYCTEWQYYTDMSTQIDWYKNKYMRTRNEAFKNKWLRLAGERLKWLSDKKVDLVSRILWLIRGHRTLTFCNSIEQTEELGSYCINSKNKESANILNAFNDFVVVFMPNFLKACRKCCPEGTALCFVDYIVQIKVTVCRCKNFICKGCNKSCSSSLIN